MEGADMRHATDSQAPEAQRGAKVLLGHAGRAVHVGIIRVVVADKELQHDFRLRYYALTFLPIPSRSLAFLPASFLPNHTIPFFAPPPFLPHEEEAVDEDVEVEGGEAVARVVVVPHADLHGRHHRRVQQQHPAHHHLPCRANRARAGAGLAEGRASKCAL